MDTEKLNFDDKLTAKQLFIDAARKNLMEQGLTEQQWLAASQLQFIEQAQKELDTEKAYQKSQDEKNFKFIQLSEDKGIEAIVAIATKSPQALEIFLNLAKLCGKTNGITISGTSIARMLNIPNSRVSDALKLLTGMGYIKRIDVDGTPTIALNDAVVWKGVATDRKKSLFNSKIANGGDSAKLVKSIPTVIISEQVAKPKKESVKAPKV